MADKYYVWLLLFSITSYKQAYADFNEFEEGFTRSYLEEPFKKIYKNTRFPAEYLLKPESEANYFAIDHAGAAIQGFDQEGHRSTIPGANIRGKALSRWEYLKPPEVILSKLEGLGSEAFLHSTKLTQHTYNFVGCLSKSPLRYGDVENDGENELALFLDEEMVVFSPQYERIVFAMFMSANDLMRAPEYTDLHGAVSALDGKQYQYASAVIGNRYEKAHQAHRAYTKVYEGDFDEDGNPDLLTWQKIYASNEVGEAPGFSLVDSQWYHYERDLAAQEASGKGITGEYLPEATSAETIQSWLLEKELTWAQGFPSSSECEGEVGELIPEMHDSLLNDPEVLQ